MSKVLIAGLDGSKTNFGVARLLLDIDTLELTVDDLLLVKTEKDKSKQVRKSSDNLKRAQEIAVGIRPALQGCVSAFIEVPSGGQSYDAVLGFGIVIGLYASLTIPTIEVSPGETKLASVGTRTASKQEMIEWAVENYPKAPWRVTKRGGVMVPTLDNEHLADAIAIAHAGIRTPAFRQTLAILTASSAKAA
ncbi:hypothetical protein [Ancylobacter rudongensis]|uniref:Holliday junction resolvasome RuvABC endonuclease subunit n=1 Tax=Ancylobacter rudongensis TaxID=177413 RepID=A0A1G4USU5_9HYPH|nr:hypothetical protein [Ancylobacter rudongensis]SCW95859.1 hypothetical protein SAMN05660859_0134 [Ancylobacter rudongensis]